MFDDGSFGRAMEHLGWIFGGCSLGGDCTICRAMGALGLDIWQIFVGY